MFEWLPTGVELSREVSAAAWFVDRLRARGLDRLSSFLPSGFEAYVRIFHPAAYRPCRSGDLDYAVAIRWEELAAARGMDLTPDVTFPEITGMDPGSSELAPLEPLAGTLPPETCTQLASILRERAARAETCWFCLWDGNGFFWSTAHGYGSAAGPELERLRAAAKAQDEILSSFPKLDAGIRRYFLCRGPLEAACAFFDTIGSTPNLWWPADRTWIVVTEVDSYSTYVGSTRAAVREILASPDIEAIEVDLEALIDPGV